MLKVALFLTLAVATQAAPNSVPWQILSAAKPISQISKDEILRFEPMTPFDEIWASFKQEHGRYSILE